MIRFKDILDEIKITPSGIPSTNYELANFLSKHQEDFIEFIERNQDSIVIHHHHQWEDMIESFYKEEVEFTPEGEVCLGDFPYSLFFSLKPFPRSPRHQPFPPEQYITYKGIRIYYEY